MDSLRRGRRQVGLTTTRRGEMTSPEVVTSPDVIRGRRQAPQQRRHGEYASLPPRSRPGLARPSSYPCASLQQCRSPTLHIEPRTDERERRVSADRASSTLPLPRRAQLAIVDDGDRPWNVAVVGRPQHQCYRNQHRQSHHHHQQQHGLHASLPPPLPSGLERPTISVRLGPFAARPQKYCSRTPYNDQWTDERERRMSEDRSSSTLPLLQPAQLADGRPGTLGVPQSLPCRSQSHHQQQEPDGLRHAYHSSSAYSRTSTLRSANSTSTGSQGYFTDCELSTEESRHRPRRRRRHPPQPASASPLQQWQHPSATEDRLEFRRSHRPQSAATSASHHYPTRSSASEDFRGGATSSRSTHDGDAGLRQPAAAGRNRCGKFEPRSRSCERTSTGSRRTGRRDDGRRYATWSGSTVRRYRSLTNCDDCSEPGRLEWNLTTPHGVLSLSSTRWRERSAGAGCSTSGAGPRRPGDVRSLTVPRRLRQSSCEGHRSRTLPASFRARAHSAGVTMTDETVGLEPIGRGVETLECERCYRAATAHLRQRCGPHTTLPATDVDSIAPHGDTARHRHSLDSRPERVGSARRTRRDAGQNYGDDSATTTLSEIPNQSLLTAGSHRDDRLDSPCTHWHGT